MAAALLGSSVALTSPAAAHVVADLSATSPAEGATVGTAVDIVIAASGGPTEFADFTLLLDGRPVGRDGTVGPSATFTSLSLSAGKELRVPLSGLAAGSHTLTIRYAPDVDSQKPDVTRTFIVDGSDGDNPRSFVWLAGAIALLLLVIAFLIRRRAFGQR